MFKYDKRDDCFICPAGQKLLRYDHKKPNGDRWRYRAERKVCEQCKFFSQCITSKTWGRQVVRNVDVEHIEWADSCLPKYERKRLTARRKYKAEGSFTNAANNHGYKRVRWRDLSKMRIQNLMFAAIQNLGKLLRYGGFGGRSIATAKVIKAFLRSVDIVLYRLSNIYTAYERILSYQRAIPAYPGKL